MGRLGNTQPNARGSLSCATYNIQEDQEGVAQEDQEGVAQEEDIIVHYYFSRY